MTDLIIFISEAKENKDDEMIMSINEAISTSIISIRFVQS